MSMLLSASELDQMRDTVEQHALPDLADVQRKTDASDEMGGRTETWGTVQRSVPCRISQPGGNTPGLSMIGKVIADRAGNRPVFVASLPAEADVNDGDRLVVNGDTFDVLMIVNGSWEIARRAMVIRLE